jgi:CHAD domain-containing protein
MYKNYLSNHSGIDPVIQSLGEYFSYLTTKFVSLFKTRPKFEVLFVDESDDSMTAHELDEHQTNEKCYDIDQCLTTNQQIIYQQKRSVATRKERNHKSSLRHRRNRYNFELIHPNNTTIANANIVQSTLYIGLKSKDFQDYFEKLLPMGLFI